MTSTLLRGAEHPRVEVAPPAVDTRLGDIAAILSERAGLKLEPWQADGLRTMLSRREDGKWAAFEYGEICARQNGKTGMFLARALAGFLLLGEQTIVWSAHELKTAMRSWRDLRRMLRRLGTEIDANTLDIDGITVKIKESNGKEGFERLDTEQEIKIVARSKGSGRGFSGDFIFIDEAFAYEQSQQDALMPILLARPNGQIGYASSPPLSGLTGGPMYALRKRAESRDPVELDRLAWRDWGLAVSLDEVMAMQPSERRRFLDDREKWAATNPAWGGGRVDEESIAVLRRSMSEEGFSRELLGCWPKEATAAGDVISEELWRDRADETSRPAGSALVFALDVSPGSKTAAIASSGRREDERLHIKLVDYRPSTGWVVDRLIELRDRWNPKKILLDPSGPAGALIADLNAEEEKRLKKGLPSLELELVSGREMAQACGALVNDLTEDRIRHCNQEALNDAVQQATPRPVADAWAWNKKQATADICPLVAVTLAAHGFRLYGATEEVIPWVVRA